MQPSLTSVALGNVEAMLAIRTAVLRESRDRLGRFDPVRSSECPATGFVSVGGRALDMNYRWVAAQELVV